MPTRTKSRKSKHARNSARRYRSNSAHRAVSCYELSETIQKLMDEETQKKKDDLKDMERRLRNKEITKVEFLKELKTLVPQELRLKAATSIFAAYSLMDLSKP